MPIHRIMATEKQIAANRQNARNSTGPRTRDGKKRVSVNALKHGLLSQRVVLPDEDEEEFAEFSLGLEQQLQPAGELEEFLVGLIAAYAWRLRRLMRVEKGLLLRYVYNHVASDARNGVFLPAVSPTEGTDEVAVDHEDSGSPEEAALKRAAEADTIRNGPDALLGRAFMTDANNGDSFSKLSRYEAHVQRSMFKALDDLKRLQVARGQVEPSSESEASEPLGLAERNGDRLA